MRKAVALFCFIFLCGAGSALAQGRPSGAPEALSAWRDWVLYGYEERYYCPSVGAGVDCVWPVSLSMNLDSAGGRFTLTAELFLEGDIILPGDAEAWPVDMTDANGVPVPVLRNLNSSNVPPQAWLPAGRHTLSGRFEWPKMPETITIPSGYALDLTVDGEKQNFPVMETSAGQTRLWLRQAEEAPPDGQSADSLSVTVNRLITDSQPMMIASRFRLTVTGQAREVFLNNALLPDTRATLLSSPLPAQLNGTGLRVKVKPGVYEIVLESRSLNQSEAVGQAPDISATLWGREFWAYEAQPQLRLAEISGAGQIDPSQADIFEDWKRFPIYAPEPGAKLIFTSLRRGDPEAQPDQLNLSRECWLDYDGKGLSCRDQMTGTLSRQWHLNTSSPFSLAQATLDGQAQVITRQTDSKGNEAPGLQLRKGALNLTADLRIDDFSGTLPASGWDHDLETGGQTINLPPGYRIFHARGADVLRADGRGAGTWTGSWSTLDFFVVLIISIAAWKLYGPRWGALALIAMIFCYQEQLAPRMLFLHLLGTSAILRLLPPVGKIRAIVRLWRFAAILLLIALSSLFLINQARVAIYPQLESPNAWYGDSFYSLLYSPEERVRYARQTDMAPKPMEESLMEAEATMDLLAGETLIQAPAPSSMAAAKRGLAVEPPRQQTANFAQSQILPPDARVQNSLARPAWNWRSVRLYYNGNVSVDQTVDFIFISPAMGRFLGLLRIALMTVFTLMMLGEGRVALKNSRKGNAATVMALMLSLAALFFPAPLALAQEGAFPSPQMLDEYRTRLMAERQEPGGFPSVGFPLATLTLTENSLRLEMEVETARPTVWPLPSLDGEFFRYARVTLGDGAALPLLEYGGLYTWLPAGIHRVTMEGPYRLPAGRDSFQLSFTHSVSPVKLIADAPGFRVEGLEPDGRVRGEAINIFAANGATQADPEDAGGSQVLEPFFIISRTISMGLEWQVNTVVSRLVTSDAPVSFKAPLIPGEEPMGEEFRREGQEMTVNFAPGQEYVQWVSRLEAVPELTLKAADGPFTESWALDASPLWRVKYDGLTPVHTASGGYWQPAWRPWPGEELRLAIDRPQPVPGVYRVIDKAALTLEGTENLRNYTLNFTVRGSQAGPYSFTLPLGAKIKTFSVDGQSMPLTPAGGASGGGGPTLTAPLSAGSHDIAATWLDETPPGTALSTPKLDLGVETANISIKTRLPEDRWVLWTSGPLNGPAVQFWPLLALLFLGCLFLARFKTPLSRSAWFLLGLGLIQLHIFGAMLVAGWLLALGHRAEWEKKWSPGIYNFSQIVLALWTFISLGLIYKGIQYGLLANPDMLIEGGGSYGQELNWFSDRSPGPWPEAVVYSVSTWVYKALMLAWSLWLAVNLVRWLKWGWKAFSGGGLWKKMVKAKAGEK